MIYLIDDKKNRQSNYGWSKEKLEVYKDVLTPIYTYSEIEKTEERAEIFNEGNTIIFHESFFDNIDIIHKSNSLKIRNKLIDFSKNNEGFNLVIFSGSKNSRKLSKNNASVPVSIMYQNLNIFINKLKNGDTNLEYLLFGANIKLEKELVEQFRNWHSKYNEKHIEKNE
jgi:hypothetical protein